VIWPQPSSKIGQVLGVNHVVIKVILFGTSEHKQYMDLALCPHAAKYILHKMGLATCWLAVYADDEWRTKVFHCIYIHNIKKEAMNEQLSA